MERMWDVGGGRAPGDGARTLDFSGRERASVDHSINETA